MLPKGPNVALMYATGKSGFVPSPYSTSVGPASAFVDVSGSLQTRGPVLTDETSFRDDFSGGSLSTALTGAATFTNGLDVVTGAGTLFLSELSVDDYVRLTADGNSAYARVADVVSDTEVLLDAAYAGAGGTGASDRSHWVPTIVGGSITVGSSLVNLLPALGNGNYSRVVHSIDYGPLSFFVRGSVSQRIANQDVVLGFQDNPAAPEQQAVLVLSGTDNTKVRFRTSWSSAASDTEETLVSLPAGITTAQSLTFAISMGTTEVTLMVGRSVLASHSTHIPDPYRTVSAVMSITNTAAVGSPTTLSVDMVFVSNQDRLEVTSTFLGEPLPVQISGTAPSGLQQSVNTDGYGNLQVVNPLFSGNTGMAFGRVATAATTEVAVRQTAYTEQTANFQGSVSSSSANDTAAGTGARTIRITYYDSTMAGPYTEDVILNGAAAVNLVNANHCFIEKIEVLTNGSTGSNVGTLSLFTGLGGGGTLVGTVAATGNRTQWCHHYVPSGKQCNVVTMTAGSTSGIDASFRLKLARPTIANTTEQQVSEDNCVSSSASTVPRYFNVPIKAVGPGRVTMYVTPVTTTAANWFGSIDYQEQ